MLGWVILPADNSWMASLKWKSLGCNLHVADPVTMDWDYKLSTVHLINTESCKEEKKNNPCNQPVQIMPFFTKITFNEMLQQIKVHTRVKKIKLQENVSRIYHKAFFLSRKTKTRSHCKQKRIRFPTHGRHPEESWCPKLYISYCIVDSSRQKRRPHLGRISLYILPYLQNYFGDFKGSNPFTDILNILHVPSRTMETKFLKIIMSCLNMNNLSIL